MNEAIELIEDAKRRGEEVELIDLDHDLGDYAKDGGDVVNFLYYLAQHEIYPPVKIHTSNPVGRKNMIQIVNRFLPEELKIYF